MYTQIHKKKHLEIITEIGRDSNNNKSIMSFFRNGLCCWPDKTNIGIGIASPVTWARAQTEFTLSIGLYACRRQGVLSETNLGLEWGRNLRWGGIVGKIVPTTGP